MVKEKYREIVAVETGGVPGTESGYYYYDSRPNTPTTLLFQPTTSETAYEQSRTKGTPTAGAFFGKGTGAPGYYTTTKTGEKKYNPGGEGRYQLLNYTSDKVTPQQIAQGKHEAKLRKMSATDQEAYKLAQVMKQLSTEQRAGVKMGTSQLFHRPGGYAPPTDLFGEYGIKGSGKGAFNPESWFISETQKGLEQRRQEAQMMWELGEGPGIPPIIGLGDQLSLEELQRELEFNPRTPFAQEYGAYIQRDPTSLSNEFGFGAGYFPTESDYASAILQYEADQIPRYKPIEPYSLSQNLQDIFGSGPWIPDFQTHRPESWSVDPITGVGSVTWGDSPPNLGAAEAAKLMLIPGYANKYKNWEGIQAGLGDMSAEYQRIKDMMPPPWQVLADQLYPRDESLTTWDQYIGSGLGNPYENPGQGGDSIFGKYGFAQALANKYGYQTPYNTYDEQVRIWDRRAESLNVDPLTGLMTVNFGASPTGTNPLTQFLGHHIDAQMRQERMLFEGPKAGLNLLDIPGGLAFIIGAGQVPGQIWRGGRTPDDYAAFMQERNAIRAANRRPQSWTVDPVTGEGMVNWENGTVPSIGRWAEAGSIGSGIGDWAAAIPGALGAAYKKDPDLFVAQMAGELAAYPLIAGKLAKGGALSRKAGGIYEFIIEPGESALEAALNLKYPGLAKRLGGSLGPEELIFQGLLQSGLMTGRAARRGYRGLEDYMLSEWTPTVNHPGSYLELTRQGDVISVPTGVDIPGYGPRIFETPLGTATSHRIDFPPLMEFKGQTWEVDELTDRMISKSERALDARLRKTKRIERAKEIKEEREDYLDYVDAIIDYDKIITELQNDPTFVGAIDSTFPSRGGLQYRAGGTMSAEIQKAYEAQSEENWAKKQKMAEYFFGTKFDPSGSRGAYRAFKGRRGAPYRNPILVPESSEWYDWRRAANVLPEAIPLALGMDFAFPSLRQSMRGLQGLENIYLKQRMEIDPMLRARQQIKEEEKYLEDFEPIIDARVLRGIKPDLDWMPPEAIFTPRQLLEQQLKQRQQLQDPMSYAPDSALQFNFPAQDVAMMESDLALNFPPGQRLQPPLQIITPIETTIQGQPTAVKVDEKYAYDQRFDMAQHQRLKAKQKTKAKSRLKLDLKRKKDMVKAITEIQKRTERTRRKFLMNLFKNEIDIPRVNVPSVNIPSVNIPSVNIPDVLIPGVRIPSVNVPSVNVEAVNIPAINVPSVNIPSVNVPKVDYKVNVPSVNVPKVHVPAVRIYE
jgi:hypothetical protein